MAGHDRAGAHCGDGALEEGRGEYWWEDCGGDYEEP